MIQSLDVIRRPYHVRQIPFVGQRRASHLPIHGCALLEGLDRVHSPRPGAVFKPVTIVLDNGPIRVSKATRAALAERKHWITPERMAKYAPELNDIEREWKTLEAHRQAHKTSKNRDDLKIAIDADIQEINSTRTALPLANQRISA